MISRGVEYATSFHENEFSVKEALKTHAYWLITITYTIQLMVSGAMNIHMIPFLTDMGIELAVASGMMSLMVFASIPSRFLGGVMADRVGKQRLNLLMAAIYFLQAAGITAFLLDRGTGSIYTMIIFYGICSGASVPLLLIIIGRYFGRKAFGSIVGTSNAIRAPFAMIAPVFAGWIYDISGNYIPALILFAAASALAMSIMCLVRPPVLSPGVRVKE
jgi:cyanate permease